MINTNTNTMTTTEAQNMIKAEIKRRTDLVYDEKFRTLVLEASKKLGITAKEWNENKAMICMLFANEFCAIESGIR